MGRLEDQQLSTYLSQMAELYGNQKHGSFPSQVLKHGRIWTIAEKQPSRMTPKQCFENAYLFSNESHIYCEGWAVPSNIPLPIWHAWCLNLEGEVLELTWEAPGLAYIGIPAQQEWLIDQICEYREYGIGGEVCADGFPGLDKEWIHPVQAKGQPLNIEGEF